MMERNRRAVLATTVVAGGLTTAAPGATTDRMRAVQADGLAGVLLQETGLAKAYQITDSALPGSYGGYRARAGPAAVQNGDLIAQFSSHGYDGTTFSRGASMFVRALETWSGTARGSDWDIRARTPGTTAEVTVLYAGTAGLDAQVPIKRAGTQVVNTQGAAVADASGGAIIDVQARAAVNDLLARVRTHGLIAT